MQSVQKIIRDEVRPYYLNLLFICLMKMGSIGLEAFAPWPFKLLIDNVLDGAPLDPNSFFGHFLASVHSRMALGYIVVGLFLFSNVLLEIFEYLYSITLKRVVNNIIFQFSKTSFIHIAHFDLSFFRKQEIGDFIYRLNYDVAALGSLIEDSILPLFSSSLYLIVTTLIMASINMKLTLIALGVLPFLAGGLYIFNEKIIKVTQKDEELNSNVFSFIQQAFTQLRTIQAFSREKTESVHFNDRLGHALKTEIRLHQLNFGLTLVIGVIISLSYSLVIVIGFNDVVNGFLSTGLLIVFIFYLDNLTSPILSIIYALSSSKEANVKIDRMDDFFRDDSRTTDIGRLTEVTDFNIRFENVTMEGNEEKTILDKVTCQMKHKEITAIVGISGSGKTSLISLIPRLLGDPLHGAVYIGEHDVREYTLQTLRDAIAYVPQEGELFNDTIYNIIAYGKHGATAEEVYHAARLAEAHGFITEMPNGYETKVGESGNFLSGGQRQRLMLARAFIRDAQILIFDEPLSFLDIKSRDKVWENIQRLAQRKTVIVVTNLLGILSTAQQVILINRGKIVDTGKHSGLLKPESLYKLMIKSS